MYPAAFDYSAPSTVDDAVRLLAQLGDNAKLLAGGHSLLPLMKLRFAQPTHVVDLRRIQSLRGVRRDDQTLVIGAMTTYAELAASRELFDVAAAVTDAASHIGDPQVRNAGTIGGSVAHADPAADLPCVMVALGASMLAAGTCGPMTSDMALVAPYNAARSYLIRKIVPATPGGGPVPGTFGQREPPDAPLPDDQIRAISDWIDGGALP